MPSNVAPGPLSASPDQLMGAAAQQQLNDRRGWTPRNLAAAATTLVDTGAGVLHAVTVNSKGTVASTVSIYDGLTAAGTLLAVIDSLNQVGTFGFDIAYSVGLCIVITGTVAPNITVAYRADD